MAASQSLARRSPASLETVRDILGTLVARYRQDEVLTSVRQIPAQEAKFRPVPGWVASIFILVARADTRVRDLARRSRASRPSQDHGFPRSHSRRCR
jgi:hypothetical protein